MNKKSLVIQRNFSTITLIAIYLIMVVTHLFYDSFVLEDQLILIITMLPFIMIGLILDFILRRNLALNKSIRIVAQLLPSGIFGMQLISTFLIYAEKEPSDLFNYLIWLFLALPFFIASYNKEGHKHKMISSLIGAGLIAVVYLFLTTQTDLLNEGSGAIIYFTSYFLMLYAASGIRKLPYLGIVLGVLNTVALLWLRYMPVTEDAINHGWDYDIFTNVELLIMGTLLLCILIRFLEVFQPKAIKTERIA
ncbi:MAG: hypothetical protein ACYDEX_19320 [Mobilitalea sp.]